MENYHHEFTATKNTVYAYISLFTIRIIWCCTQLHMNTHACMNARTHAHARAHTHTHTLFNIVPMLFTGSNKHIKQSLQISWSTHCLRVKLDTKVWLPCMYYSLIGPIIGIGEQNWPIRWQRVSVNCKTMILCCYETPLWWLVYARLIVSTVTISVQRTNELNSISI